MSDPHADLRSEQDRRRMVWAMFPVSDSAWRWIKPEAPCWKGEVHLGRLVIGWQVVPAAKEDK
jgi:hypothetical protein